MGRLKSNLKYLWAFIKRDLWVQYAWMEWVLPFELINLVFGVASWAFFIRAFGSNAQPLQQYGGDIVSYVILGMAFYGFLTYASQGMYSALLSLYAGTYWSGGYRLSWMEYIRLAGVSPSTYVIAQYALTYLRQVLISLAYIAVGFYMFGLRFNPYSNHLGASIALALGISACIGLGLISSSTIWLLGAWHGVEPVNWSINLLTSVASGVYFPPSILPEWLKTTSYYLPHTYSMEAAKLALLSGLRNEQLTPHFVELLVFSITLISIGIILTKLSLKKAEEKGSLM